MKNKGFLFFKILLWVCIGWFFTSFSVLIPVLPSNEMTDFIVFLGLLLVVNIHTSYLYPVLLKKSIWGYIAIFICSVLLCVGFEFTLFSENFNVFLYPGLNQNKIYFATLLYIFIRDCALFAFFIWIESFHRLILFLTEKEKIQLKEIELLIEKQEFEKKFSRKKLLSHYFFNILEHFYAKILENHTDSELLDKLKFVLYYFLVDAEKENVELEKELVFYQYYIDLEKFKSKKNIEVNFKVMGQVDDYKIIPLIFEPLIGNALKYVKDDGTGWIDITIDVSNFPVLNFHCKNNYAPYSSNIISSENGLKILEQRLELCYKDKYSMNISQNTDLYEVMLSINIA